MSTTKNIFFIFISQHLFGWSQGQLGK